MKTITIQMIKSKMINVQNLCKRGIHDVEQVDKEAVAPLLELKKVVSIFLQENNENIEALRYMYYIECYLLNFKNGQKYLEKVCALSNDRKDKMNLLKLRELVVMLKEIVLSPTQIKQLIDFLEENLSKEQCNHTHKFTKQWLIKYFDNKQHSKIIKGLQNMGGYCDCEIVLNVTSL